MLMCTRSEGGFRIWEGGKRCSCAPWRKVTEIWHEVDSCCFYIIYCNITTHNASLRWPQAAVMSFSQSSSNKHTSIKWQTERNLYPSVFWTRNVNPQTRKASSSTHKHNHAQHAAHHLPSLICSDIYCQPSKDSRLLQMCLQRVNFSCFHSS